MNALLRTVSKGFTVLRVFLYRVSGGLLRGGVWGSRVLLLTTTGRKTGKAWTTPIGYIRDGNSYAVIASNAGSDRNPGWYLILQQHPTAEIQVGRHILTVRAEITGGDQRQRLWSQVIAAAPGYAAYQRRTHREIPIVILTPERA